MLIQGAFGEHHPERPANCKRFLSKLESSSSDVSFLFPSSNLQSHLHLTVSGLCFYLSSDWE